MEEEKICPICGLKMERVSPQSWVCKCGYRERVKPQKPEEEKKKEQEEAKVKHWEERKKNIRKRPSTRHKKGFGSTKKRGEGY